jgi:hypothetical protein
VPSRHGFPFPNWFPPGTPVIEVPTPFGRVPIGDAGGGVCGGMVFTALDLFAAGAAVPAEPTPAVVRHLGRRLLDSFDLPFGVLRYYDWQRRPLASRLVGGVRVRAGVSALTAAEWPRVRAALDATGAATLGLVKAHSFDPRAMGRHHQVLAYAYTSDEATGKVAVKVYDPNYPLDDGIELRADLSEPDAGRPVTHSAEGETVRGFFLTEYRRAETVSEFA